MYRQKKDAKKNTMATVEDKDKFEAVFSSIKMKEKMSKIGKLSWDTELMHFVRIKPRGMEHIRVEMGS